MSVAVEKYGRWWFPVRASGTGQTVELSGDRAGERPHVRIAPCLRANKDGKTWRKERQHMKKQYETPSVEMVKFQYKDQVVAQSGSCITWKHYPTPPSYTCKDYPVYTKWS